MVTLFVSCEEYYHPVLEQVPGMMVVESRLTNDPKQNFVRLSMTRNFNSTDAVEWITSAKIELMEVKGKTTSASQIQPGYYTFQETPVTGKAYVLKISYQNDIFESDPVVMPPMPTIDALYALHKDDKVYRTNAYGVPELFTIPGREISIDATLSPELQNFLFSWRTIILWKTYPPNPPKYGWKSFYDEGNFNLCARQDYSISDKINHHPLFSLAYNSQKYLDSPDYISDNWIVIIDQYGISEKSYKYHKKLNMQLSAEASLFEPQVSQVYGNVHCKNNPSKIILGYFDVNSYRQYRYYLNLGLSEKSTVVLRKLNTYPHIPASGDTIAKPKFWESN
jgi:hypothetical protein